MYSTNETELNTMNTEAVKLKAPIKDYIWGGRRLIEEFGKETDAEKAAESWELSTHPAGESTVITGSMSGMKLSEYIDANGMECLGANAEKFSFFPVLIKLIDTKNDLSIQVHPDDDYAMRVEGEYGKTEMWYIVDCDEGAYLYYGLDREVTKEEFARRIKDNTLLEILNKVYIKKGDVFFIPSGTIHAICRDTLICEVQQNSNTTYRVYDYDRRGKDGKPRELHIAKAIDVSRLSPSPAQPKANGNVLASCKYFTVEKLVCGGECKAELGTDSFRSLVITDGSGTLTLGAQTMEIKKGDSVFIPAQSGAAIIKGRLETILTRV